MTGPLGIAAPVSATQTKAQLEEPAAISQLRISLLVGRGQMTKPGPVDFLVEMADGVIESLRPVLEGNGSGQVPQNQLAEQSALALVHAYLQVVQAIESLSTAHALILQLRRGC